MKVLRILLFPFVPIYFAVTWLRNRLYDWGFKSSKSYDFPVICVGNLSTGGTGKTPLIEYLIGMLSKQYTVATLSRGYKRNTKGFLLASKEDSALSIGDEPYQFLKKFSTILVAVDENRQHGIESLRNQIPQPNLILLDDAFQHRKVKAGLNILLTSYDSLYYIDIVLPTGNLREPISGAKRADIIIVTKCPNSIDAIEKQKITSSIKLKQHQSLFFSTIQYSGTIHSDSDTRDLSSLKRFTLVTGVANPKPLVEYLNSLNFAFEHIEFPDHYKFEDIDIERLASKELILTTEKDFVRLEQREELRERLFYLPIEFKIDRAEEFRKAVLSRI